VTLSIVTLKKLLFLFFLLTFLAGCFDDKTEIKAHIAEVKKNTTNYIEPMPEVKDFIHISYSAKKLRSPFVLPEAEIIQQKIQQMVGCLSPDLNRRKQPLEKYALSDLTMRGTLGDADMLWVLLEASDKSLHRVALGNYLGLYNGQITEVSESEVNITELAPDGTGCWVERETTLSLINSEEPNK
jgi:type IV pilus assembly protein PilP